MKPPSPTDSSSRSGQAARPAPKDGRSKKQVSVMPQGGLRVVRNVSQPTLTAYFPDPKIATGTAVIVCPGGAFHFLAYEHEGIQVAAWLNARGIAAFMLKYRLIRTGGQLRGGSRRAPRRS